MRILRVLALLAPLAVPAAAAAAQSASPTAPLHKLVADRYVGDSAFRTVAFLDQFVRWPGNRGFDASIAHIVERLEAAGYVREDRAAGTDLLTYRVERYPMQQPAWEPLDARVELVGEAAPLLAFATNRNMLNSGSNATPAGGVTAEVVDVGRGTAAELDKVDVRGKIVLAAAGAGRVFAEAVQKRGAVGVLGFALPAYLQPSKHVHSIQFGSVPRDSAGRGWGIQLSYAANERLRAAMARAAQAGTPLRLKVVTDVKWTPNAVEQAVVAEVRGSRFPAERFVFSAHVQEPGANDNASGVGAQVEMARVAAALVRERRVAPARTITFLWGLEIRSTDRYITQDSVRARGIRWGLSLDMVGEDTRKTGGTFLIEKMPDPSAIWTRGDEKHTEWGGSPITKAELTPHYFNDLVLGRALEQAATNGWVVRTNPFEGGSDHTPFLKAKKPGLLLWHFTDEFYHTDGDRIDMVSPDELRNVGITALVTALAMTTADGALTRRLIDEIVAAAEGRATTEGRLSLAEVRAGKPRAAELDILATWSSWYVDALGHFTEVELGGPSAATTESIARAQDRVRKAFTAAASAIP